MFHNLREGDYRFDEAEDDGLRYVGPERELGRDIENPVIPNPIPSPMIPVN